MALLPFALTYRPHIGFTSRADSPTTPGRSQRLFVVTLPLRSSGKRCTYSGDSLRSLAASQ